MKQNRFNPYNVFNGVFIPEAVMSIPVSALSHGAKLCYGRLLRFAGRNGTCYPSIKAISLEIGVSDDSIKNYIKELKDFGLIEVERPDINSSNHYFFLYHDVFLKTLNGEEESQLGGVGYSTSEVENPIRKESHIRESYKSIHHREAVASQKESSLHPENQKLNKPTGVLINSLISGFKEIDPLYARHFNNKTQRKAAEDLLVGYPLAEIIEAIKFRVSHKKDRFCPSFTTPLQLLNKYIALEEYYEKNK